MLGLTLRSPWASAIAELGKDVENRVWRTGYRGPIAVHAGQGVDVTAPASVTEALKRRLPRGHIVAVADLCDVVRDSASEWAREGHFHWLLNGVRVLVQPIPCTGRQGLFRLPVEVEHELLVALAPLNGRV